jgi:hypothetical protein
MQIHELTRKKQVELDEGLGDVGGDIGQMGGEFINTARNIGGAIASPFKDVAQGYKSARQDQKVSAMADKAFRTWQNYVVQLEQSIAKQPAPATAPVTKKEPEKEEPLKKEEPPVGGANANATKNTNAPGATVPPATKPNYGAQTGAGATVTYKQPAGVPNPMAKTPQPTNPKAIGPTTPGVTTTTPAGTTTTPAKTVASTAPGQPITVGGQKLKPGTKEYDQIANAPLKELQEPAAPVAKTALDAFRARTDGKYEAYLTAFVQKNLLAGLGFKGLVNQQEITNDIKEISKPENNDPSKQRPLWNDLVRDCALAVPAAGALTGRDPKAPKDSNAPDATKPGEEKPGEEKPGEEKPAAPTMTKDQISQWITRNSEDHAALSAFLAAINSAGKA